MNILQRLRSDWALANGVRRTLAAYGKIGKDWPETVGDDLEATVDKFSANLAFRFEGHSITYAEFDAMTNRVARWARGRGLRKGDTVALIMPNRPDYVAIWMGLAKVGCVTALINTHLTGASLAHCINIAACEHIILDAELAGAFASAAPTLTRPPIVWAFDGPIPNAEDLTASLAGYSPERLSYDEARGDLVGGDLCLLVYTSGTTGLPKAARMPHWRVQGMLRAFIGGAQPKATDRTYITLPLYHSTGGLTGIGLMLERGGCIILRRKFSASQFWVEIRDEGATIFFYVGELCRYLLNQPFEAHERQHLIRIIVGNGLRPDVWARFVERFNIPKVLEFYGSTEGNVSMANFDGKIGAVGRMPAYFRKAMNARIVKFDVETEAPIRGIDGLCREADADEVGEVVGEIKPDQPRYQFEGYTGDAAQTNKKILRDVFVKGDSWFRTGDLMKRDKSDYFYFVDRIGDTYRWKGENVSTNEVAESLTGFRGVREANVYGVKIGSLDGRAGMAALTVGPDFDLSALPAYLRRELPAYARPIFIRLQHEIETTGTFKYRKVDLINDGFDPAKISDPLYFDDPAGGGFTQLTSELGARIWSGALRL